MKATRVILGAICFNNASDLPKMESSNVVKPVRLPPGRAKFVAQPTPTGSRAPGATIGIVRESCCNTRPDLTSPDLQPLSGSDHYRSRSNARLTSTIKPSVYH